MENLNLVNTKYAIEMLRNHGVSNGGTLGFHAGWCDIAADQLESALALITSQEQKIKELTQAHEMLSESYDHLEKTKDELLSERAMLTEENSRLEKLFALRDQDNKDTQDLLYKAEAENERLMRDKTALECIVETARNQAKADTVRKMHERLKAVAYQSNDWSHGEHPMVVEVEDIDQIAKEMLEVSNE